MIRIGVTETYDPAYCIQDWYYRYDEFDLVIFITKSLNSELIRILTEDEHWKFSVKPSILHITVTGFGGTELEPGCKSSDNMYEIIQQLISAGYPKERMVLRIDPIIPNKDGMETLIKLLTKYKDLGISRVRVSVLDMYLHSRERLLNSKFYDICRSYNQNSFRADFEWFDQINEIICDEDVKHLTFESCNESLLLCEHIGCVSKKDLILNDLPLEDLPPANQRYGCLCLLKKQLIPGGMSRGRCPNKCLYCYLKDNNSD